MRVAAGGVPHVQALPHHDEQAGHEGCQESCGGGEPEVVGRPEPTDGSDEDSPYQDQSTGGQPGQHVKIHQDVVTEFRLQLGTYLVYIKMEVNKSFELSTEVVMKKCSIDYTQI